MARTQGSGWGAGVILYQVCPQCGKKKCFYDPVEMIYGLSFYCCSCKQRSPGDGMVRLKYNHQLSNTKK